MRVDELPPGPPAPELRARLASFERRFLYPLGPSLRFRIDHGPDYRAFFTTLGPSRTWLAWDGESLVGVASVALRQVAVKGREWVVAYLGDLKVDPEHRSGAVLHRLLERMLPLGGAQASAGYGLVPEGAATAPDRYSGRLGLPRIEPLDRVYIERLATAPLERAARFADPGEGYRLYRHLTWGSAALELGIPERRSAMPPRWLDAGGQACGLLEDTRRAKRLFLESGEELVAAHLSFFTFETTSAGKAVLRSALGEAFRRGYPQLLVALDDGQREALAPALEALRVTEARATRYGTDALCRSIPVNTSEI